MIARNFRKINNILFYISYTILIVHYILKSITFFDNKINTIVYAIGISILILLSIINILEKGLKSSTIVIIISIALVILCILTHDLLLPTIWLLIIAFGKKDFDKLVEYDIVIKTALVLLVVTLSLVGVLDIGSTHLRGEAVRLSLGFNNPNMFSTYVLSIVFEISYLRRKQYGILEIIMSLVAVLIIFFTTGSRTQIACIFFANILLIANKKSPKILSNKIINWVGNNLFTIITIICLIGLSFYILVPQSREAINSVFPDRIRLPANELMTSGLWLFGNPVYQNLSTESPLDNLPLFITIVYGIIPLLITCLLMNKYMKDLNNETTRTIYLIMLVFLMSAFTEKICFRPQYNIFLLYSSTFLYDNLLRMSSRHNKVVTLQPKKTPDTEYLTLKELQQSELKILKWFDDFCQKNNLRYYIYGGTLLGAVRHRGFIPWDDDIDTIMPRPDYEKLSKLLKNHGTKNKNIKAESPEITNSTNYPFLKIFDTNVKIIEAGNAIDATSYAWIDVFPVDGINEPTQKNLKKTSFLKRIFESRRAQIYNSDSKKLNNFQKTLHRIRRSPLHIIPLNKYLNYFIKKCKDVKFQDSEYVCDTVWAKHPGNILKKEWLDKTIRMPFENIEVNVFDGYKYYLENRYGKDYMKLPPKEKQITHGIKAYKIDKTA